MKFKLTMDLGNAAFEDNRAYEIARILRDIAAHIEDGMDDEPHGNCYDINGNNVGHYQTTTR